MSSTAPLVVATAKWLDLHPDVDRLDASVRLDPRRGGFSAADRAALEIALVTADSMGGTVRLVSAGPAAAEPALAQLGAAGASEIIRVDLDPAVSSTAVAEALTPQCRGAAVVVCGDMSLDRGSASVPAFLAHHLGAAQALGLLSVTPPGSVAEPLVGLRRLDGGRRELLEIPTPAVVSVEGAVATLRRASLTSIRSAPASVRVITGDAGPPPRLDELEAWRPPTRLIAAPEGDDARTRIIELTGALVERTPPRRLEADPAEAAAEIARQLEAWGYLD